MPRFLSDRRIRYELLAFFGLRLVLTAAGFGLALLGIAPFWRTPLSILPIGGLLPPYAALLLVFHALARCGQRNWVPVLLLWALSPLAAMAGALALVALFGRLLMTADWPFLLILGLYPPLIGALTAQAVGALARKGEGEAAGAPWRWALSGALIGAIFAIFNPLLPITGWIMMRLDLSMSFLGHGWPGILLGLLLSELMMLAGAVLAMLPLYLRPAVEPRPAARRGWGFRLTFGGYALIGIAAAGLWLYQSRILAPALPAIYGLTSYLAPDCPAQPTAACVDRWMTGNAAWLKGGWSSTGERPDYLRYAGDLPRGVALRQARALAAADHRDSALVRAEAGLRLPPEPIETRRRGDGAIITSDYRSREDAALRDQLAILAQLLRGEPPRPPAEMTLEALAEALIDVRALADAGTAERMRADFAARVAAGEPRGDFAYAAARDDAAAAEALLAAGRADDARRRLAAIGDADFRKRWLGGDYVPAPRDDDLDALLGRVERELSFADDKAATALATLSEAAAIRFATGDRASAQRLATYVAGRLSAALDGLDIRPGPYRRDKAAPDVARLKSALPDQLAWLWRMGLRAEAKQVLAAWRRSGQLVYGEDPDDLAAPIIGALLFEGNAGAAWDAIEDSGFASRPRRIGRSGSERMELPLLAALIGRRTDAATLDRLEAVLDASEYEQRQAGLMALIADRAGDADRAARWRARLARATRIENTSRTGKDVFWPCGGCHENLDYEALLRSLADPDAKGDPAQGYQLALLSAHDRPDRSLAWFKAAVAAEAAETQGKRRTYLGMAMVRELLAGGHAEAAFALLDEAGVWDRSLYSHRQEYALVRLVYAAARGGAANDAALPARLAAWEDEIDPMMSGSDRLNPWVLLLAELRRAGADARADALRDAWPARQPAPMAGGYGRRAPEVYVSHGEWRRQGLLGARWVEALKRALDPLLAQPGRRALDPQTVMETRRRAGARLAILAARRGEAEAADSFLRLAEADGLSADRLFDARLDAALALAPRDPAAARARLAPLAADERFKSGYPRRPIRIATARALLGHADPDALWLPLRHDWQLLDIAGLEQRLDIGVPPPPALADALAGYWRALFRPKADDHRRRSPFTQAIGQWDVETALAWHRVLKRLGREAEWNEGWRDGFADLTARTKRAGGAPAMESLGQEAEMLWISLATAEAAGR